MISGRLALNSLNSIVNLQYSMSAVLWNSSFLIAPSIVFTMKHRFFVGKKRKCFNLDRADMKTVVCGDYGGGGDKKNI